MKGYTHSQNQWNWATIISVINRVALAKQKDEGLKGRSKGRGFCSRNVYKTPEIRFQKLLDLLDMYLGGKN